MKKTVCTITLNPALDLSGTVDRIKPNEKTYVYDEKRAPGGNAINSARILKRLGVSVLTSGFLGGSTGQEIETLLDSEQVKNEFITIRGSTRINVTVTNQADHKQTRLSFPGPQILAEERLALINFIKKCKSVRFLVIGGSLPRGFTIHHLKEFINLAKKMNMEVIVDCPGEVLTKVVVTKPLLIKPNLEEFHSMTRSRVRSISAVKRMAESYLDRVPYICVSSVENGALLVSRSGTYFGRIPAVKIISTVGAGDSMVGAMVSQLSGDDPHPQRVLQWGLAAAAATLAKSGTSLGQASTIRQLYKKTLVRQVGN